MSFLDKLRTQKLLSFTLILFTLSIGIVIGTLVNSGVKAAKDNPVAPGATPLTIPNPVELSNTFSQIAKQVEPSVVNISTTYNPKRLPYHTATGASRSQPDDGVRTMTATAGWTISSTASSAAIPFGGDSQPRNAADAVTRSVRVWWSIRPATS